MKRLYNKRIWITRPAGQADALCQLIEQIGGEAVRIPTIEIQPIIDEPIASDYFNDLAQYDHIIFISRNAVKIAFAHYIKKPQSLAHKSLFAIGAGTAKALAEHTMHNVQQAGQQADTETLLAVSALQAAQVHGQTILIVQGMGGRDLLKTHLLQRGAKVQCAAIYRRCLPVYEAGYLKKQWQDKPPDAMIVSSNDGLQNLLNLTVQQQRQSLFKTPLVVMSNRGLSLAKKIGFNAPLAVATAKTDQGLLSALLNIVGE